MQRMAKFSVSLKSPRSAKSNSSWREHLRWFLKCHSIIGVSLAWSGGEFLGGLCVFPDWWQRWWPRNFGSSQRAIKRDLYGSGGSCSDWICQIEPQVTPGLAQPCHPSPFFEVKALYEYAKITPFMWGKLWLMWLFGDRQTAYSAPFLRRKGLDGLIQCCPKKAYWKNLCYLQPIILHIRIWEKLDLGLNR